MSLGRRIEIIPAGWEQSREKARGDGSPTVDLCNDCSKGWEEGNKLPEDALGGVWKGATIGSTDVAHPPFTDYEYTLAIPAECEECSCVLEDE